MINMKNIIKNIYRVFSNISLIYKQFKSFDISFKYLLLRIDSIEHAINQLSRNSPIRNYPIRVVFLVHHATSWSATKPVVDQLSKDSRFQVITISLPHYKLMAESHMLFGEEEIHQMLENQNIDHFRIKESEIQTALNLLKLINPDFIFRQTPWGHDLSNNLDGHSLSFTKLCYIPYGYMTAAIEEKQFNQDFHHYCYRIYWPDEIHKSLSEKYSKIKALNCIVSGYPKFDLLTSSKIEKWPISESKHLKAFKLIWAPHYSFQDNWLKFGAFNDTAEIIFNIAQSRKDIQIVLRPHPAFLEYIDEADDSTWLKKFMKKWLDLDNTAISREADYSALFRASDALLTDGLSFLSEYQLFDKPILFFEREDNIGFNEAGKQLLPGLYRITKPSEVESMIIKILNGEEDPLIVECRRKIAKSIQPFPQQASARIAEDLFSSWNSSMINLQVFNKRD